MGDDGRDSRLESFCTALMEAGWLIAAVVVPVFFNVYTGRIFEPDKIALLRSIAVLMACAWLIRLVERGGSGRQYLSGRLGNPVFLSAAAVAAVSLIATAASVNPGHSFFGSYRRMQGAYTTLCGVVVFAIIFLEMRTRRQADRLFTAIILGSLPVALYGILQRLGMDPLTWSTDPFTRSFFEADRAPSTMGNPIFTGAYLAVVSLLTIGRVAADLGGMRSARGSLPAIIRVCGFGLAALVQVVALASSASRGPWVGWLAGVSFFVFILVILSQRRRLIAGFVTAGVLGIAALLALNLGGGPLAKIRALPLLGPISHLLESERGTGKTRTLIWEGTVRLVLPHQPIRYPDGSEDPVNTLRPLIGYGPEAMPLVYGQFYPPELGHHEHRSLLIDRSHNELWDTLVSTGLIGLLAWQALLLSLFRFGLRCIGLLSAGRDGKALVWLWTGAGIAGGLVPLLLHRPGYFALGAALGTVAGMILSLLLAAGPGLRREQTSRSNGEDRVLIASLLAAILANYVEVQFGISVIASQSLFWLAAGLLVAIGPGGLRAEEDLPPADAPAPLRAAALPAGRPGKRKPPSLRLPPAGSAGPRDPALRRVIGAGLGYSLMIALILAALLFAFLSNHARLEDPLAVLWQSLRAPSRQGFPAALCLVVAVWALSCLIAAGELFRCGRLKSAADRGIALCLLSASSLGIALSFALPLAVRLRDLATSPAVEPLRLSEGIIGMYDFFVFALAAAVFLTGLTLRYCRQAPPRTVRNPWVLLPVLPLVLGGGYAAISHANLDPIRADILLREGGIHQARNRLDQAIAHFHRAAALWPSDVCAAKLGGALAARAQAAAPDSGGRPGAEMKLSRAMRLDPQGMRDMKQSELFSAAGDLLLYARTLNPLYADHSYNLARLYRRWTSLTTAAAEKTRLAEQTSAFYRQATVISPQNVVLWNEWASFLLDEQNDNGARQKIERSLALDPRFGPTHLVAGSISLKRQQWAAAEASFRTALDLTPDLAEAYDKLAYLFSVQGNFPEAIAAHRHVLRIMPHDAGIWKTHRNLAILYRKTGDHRAARAHAEQALARAPASGRQELEALAAEVGAPARR